MTHVNLFEKPAKDGIEVRLVDGGRPSIGYVPTVVVADIPKVDIGKLGGKKVIGEIFEKYVRAAASKLPLPEATTPLELLAKRQVSAIPTNQL